MMVTSPFTGLWRHADFMKLWAGQTISEFGSVVSRDALPLVGVLTLSATPAQMGLLAALGSLPALLIGLPAGAWIDRTRRKPIMIAADLASVAVLASIPVAYLLGALRIEQLYVVAALAGGLALLFDVAYTSYLPSLVEREHVVEGNSKLSASESVAEIGGSALAGALVQALSAPLAVAVDALSFLASAVSLALIRKPEPRPVLTAQSNLRREIADGLRALAAHPILRALTAAAITGVFFGNFYAALYGLYAIRELGIGPAALGLLIASGGIGSLLGAMLAAPAARRFGVGRLLIGSAALSGVLGLLIPLAAYVGAAAVAFLFVGQIAGDLVRTIYMIHALSLRQILTPDGLLGRMNASVEFLQGSAATIGVLTGGLLGQALGVQAAVWIAALGSMLAVVWLIASPVRTLPGMPTGAE
jgi:predicted MFS family arabinose efflux permease